MRARNWYPHVTARCPLCRRWRGLWTVTKRGRMVAAAVECRPCDATWRLYS